jgi:cytoskeletal protein CcmA (bactofilin family)
MKETFQDSSNKYLINSNHKAQSLVNLGSSSAFSKIIKSCQHIAENFSMKEVLCNFKKITDKPNLVSFLAKDIKITGKIEVKSLIEIDGYFQGSIKGSDVVIRSNGFVEGEIEAKNIIIRGKFEGEIKTNQLQICQYATITGKITYETLIVEDGASVDGQFNKIQIGK